jgi:hypothetical protein
MSYGAPYGDESRAIYIGSFSVQDEVEVSSAVVRFSVDVESVGTGPGYDSLFQALLDAVAPLAGEAPVHARKEWTRRRDVTPTQEE